MKYENIEHGDKFFREKHFANRGMQILKVEIFTTEGKTCYDSSIEWGIDSAIALINNEDWRNCCLPSNWTKIHIFDITDCIDEFGEAECITKLKPIQTIENK